MHIALQASASAVAVPFLEVGQRVDRAATLVPAGGGPDLEMEVAGGGVAGLADHPDRFSGADRHPLLQRRGFEQVHVGHVETRALAVDDYVVAGGALVSRVLNAAAAGGDQRRSALCHHVLALVGVAGASCSETAGGAAVVVGAEDREGVAIEVEAEAEGCRGCRRGGAARQLTSGLRHDPERVVAARGRPPFARGPVPADAVGGSGGDVVAVEALHHFAAVGDEVDAEVVGRLVAADFVAQARLADAVVEGLWGPGLGRDRAERAIAGGRVGRAALAGRRRGAAARRRRATGRGRGDRGRARQDRGKRDRHCKYNQPCAACHVPSLSFACGVSCRARAERDALRIVLRPIRPWDLQGPCGSSAPARWSDGIRQLLARQYKRSYGYDPPAALGAPRGFCTMKTYVATAADRH